MLVMMLASIALVMLTMLIHYEALRLASDALPRVPLPPRSKILFLVLVAFLAHMLEVWLYAIAYHLLATVLDQGRLVLLGAPLTGHEDFLYFSIVTYTSLGFGDVLPERELRLLAGIESLNGLVLIGWSASMTYLAMEKFWPLHARRGHGGPHGQSSRTP
jgi:hypothetical protein